MNDGRLNRLRDRREDMDTASASRPLCVGTSREGSTGPLYVAARAWRSAGIMGVGSLLSSIVDFCDLDDFGDVGDVAVSEDAVRALPGAVEGRADAEPFEEFPMLAGDAAHVEGESKERY